MTTKNNGDGFKAFVGDVRDFVKNRLIPLEQQVDRDDRVPDGVIDDMRGLGLFGLSVPERYGGLGLTLTQEACVIREMGYTAPAFRGVFGTNVGIGAMGILMDGTDQQKDRYLPVMARGDLIGAFALSEADAGSDAAALKTKAVRDGEHYIINGNKRYVTNASRAGVLTVMARTGDPAIGAKGISAFLVSSDSPGIVIAPPQQKMGLHGAPVCDVEFKNVHVDKKDLIGGVEGMGFKTAMKVLDRQRLHVSALVVGMARRLIDESLRYAMSRHQFGGPISDFQLIQAMLADSEAEYLAAKSMVKAMAADYDNGVKITKSASATKLFTTEMVGRVADRAVQIHGGIGYMSSSAVERFYRDVRLYRIFEGSSEIQKLIIAKEMIRGN